MKGTIITTILAAAGATVCCTGPALLLLFGSTTLSAFSFLEPIRPYASVLAIGILGFAYYKVYQNKPEEACCDIDKQKAVKKQKVQKITLFGITPIVLALILFPYYSGIVYAAEGNTVGEEKFGVITEWNIDGMTCEGCALGLQGGMAAVKGMNKCKVDYQSKSMLCTVNEKILKPDAIPRLVERIGYNANQKKSSYSDNKKTEPKT